MFPCIDGPSKPITRNHQRLRGTLLPEPVTKAGGFGLAFRAALGQEPSQGRDGSAKHHRHPFWGWIIWNHTHLIDPRWSKIPYMNFFVRKQGPPRKCPNFTHQWWYWVCPNRTVVQIFLQLKWGTVIAKPNHGILWALFSQKSSTGNYQKFSLSVMSVFWNFDLQYSHLILMWTSRITDLHTLSILSRQTLSVAQPLFERFRWVT